MIRFWLSDWVTPNLIAAEALEVCLGNEGCQFFQGRFEPGLSWSEWIGDLNKLHQHKINPFYD